MAGAYYIHTARARGVTPVGSPMNIVIHGRQVLAVHQRIGEAAISQVDVPSRDLTSVANNRIPLSLVFPERIRNLGF